MARVNPYKLPLTADERTAIVLAARGMIRHKAAAAMGVPTDTYKSMMQRVYAKTKTHNSTHAVAILMARGDLLPRDVIDVHQEEYGPAAEIIYNRLVTELDADKLPGLNDAYVTLLRKGL